MFECTRMEDIDSEFIAGQVSLAQENSEAPGPELERPLLGRIVNLFQDDPSSEEQAKYVTRIGRATQIAATGSLLMIGFVAVSNEIFADNIKVAVLIGGIGFEIFGVLFGDEYVRKGQGFFRSKVLN